MKTEDNRKRVALVDDDPKVITALETGLSERFNIVAKCTSGEEALKVLSTLPEDQFPHLVLLDIKMPGMGGIACCDELRRLFPDLLIALHTAKPVRERFEEARQAGADAYVVKSCLPIADLAVTLQELERHVGQCLCIAPTKSAIAPDNAGGRTVLSPENELVMRLLSHGAGIKQIADQLALHEQTVKWHLAEIRRKLAAGSNADAVRIWLDRL